MATPAAAHNVLVSSEPEDGVSLDSSPEAVTLTFDQAVQDSDINQIAVTGPDGEQWVDAPPDVDGNEVSVPLGELGPAGEYVIGYYVLSADGHPVGDEIPFTLTAGEAGTPAAGDPAAEDAGDDGADERENAPGEDPEGAAEDGDSGVGIWVWLVGAGGLLVIGVALALRLGRATG
nr:copper resistance CopC family protein [Haloechinothrix aidingensis]